MLNKLMTVCQLQLLCDHIQYAANENTWLAHRISEGKTNRGCHLASLVPITAIRWQWWKQTKQLLRTHRFLAALGKSFHLKVRLCKWAQSDIRAVWSLCCFVATLDSKLIIPPALTLPSSVSISFLPTSPTTTGSVKIDDLTFPTGY